MGISRRLGFQEALAWSLNELAILARRRRRVRRELGMLLRDSLLVHQQLGDRWRMASVLEEIAGSVLARVNASLSVQMLAFADALRERIGSPIPPVEAPTARWRSSACVANWRLRPSIPPGARGERGGSTRRSTRRVAALDQHQGGVDQEGAAPATPILTPRELAVLDLLSQGHTNREVAASQPVQTTCASAPAFSLTIPESGMVS